MESLNELTPGDILGFCGYDLISDFINLGSLGCPRIGLSHIAVIGGVRRHDGHVVVSNLIFESTTFNAKPCAVRGGEPFSGSQAQLFDKVENYPGAVWLYRLKRQLNFNEQLRLYGYLTDNLGHPYDLVGAFRSGGNLFARFQRLIHGESLGNLFCSEYVAAALREVGRFDTDVASKWSPNSLVRELRSRAAVLHPPVRIK